MQTQTHFFRFLAAALVFLPLLFLVLRTASGTPRRLKCALAAVFASSLLFFCAFHHQDLYRGLDNAMYANIAKAFRSGVQAVRVDTFFSSIPEKAAHAFVLQKSKTWHKKSHDKAFVLSPDGLSRPWFMLMHPLVASALPEDLFVPLLGAVWLTLLFLVCCRGTGVAAGVGVFCVLVFATPYPMWFFRDDFAEVSGSMLVAAALLSHSAKPLKHPAEFAVAAFLVGLATAFHRSTLLFAVPVALLFFAEAGSWKSRLAVAAAFGIGLLALWLETRYVSAPYGDWTRIVPKEPHKGSTAVKVIHKSTKYVVPKSPDYFASFAQGLKPAVRSLGFPALTLFLAGTFSLFRGKRPGIVRKALPFVLLWVLCACICRLGKDAHTGHIVGVWDFRRIFPCVIVLVSLFASPLAELVAALLAKIRLAARWKKASVAAVSALLCTLCIARNPTAYFAVDGKGNREFADEIGAELEQLKPDLVVFDYFLHHLPFVFDGRFTALGIDERKHGSWGAAAEWLADVAKTQRVAFVSSWETPPRAERSLAFSEVRKIEHDYEEVASKCFMDASRNRQKIANTILLAQRHDEEAAEASFSLSFDAGPMGLRGKWKAAPRGGMWSRPTAGFVGPLPRPGHPVEAVVITSWWPPKGAPATRKVTITCPGGSATFTAGKGKKAYTLRFTADPPAAAATPEKENAANEPFGEYQVSVKPFFDPAQYGIGGFPKDLGIVFHEVTMKPL